MKIICERCRADYDIEDAKIPASGFRMTCTACSHQIVVAAGTAPAAPAPREIALSSFEETPEEPAAAPSSPSPGSTGSSGGGISLALADDDVDFAAAGAAAASAAPAAAAPAISLALADEPIGIAVASPAAPEPAEEPDLPAAVSAPTPRRGGTPAAAAPTPPSPDEIDLPAPRRAPAPAAAPRVAATPDAGPDLPAPKKAPTPPPAAPARQSSPPAIPPANNRTVAGFGPAAPATKPDAPPVPASAAAPPVPSTAKPAPPVPASAKLAPPPVAPPVAEPQDFSLPLDLDAPDVDDVAAEPDLPTPRVDGSVDLPAPRPDGSVDLVAPRPDGSVDLPTPRPNGSVDLPAPRPDGSVDLPTPRAGAAAKLDEGAAATAVLAAPLPADDDDDDEIGEVGGRKRRRMIFVAGGVGGLLLAGGGALFGLGIIGGGGVDRHALEAKLVSARRALAEDTPTSFRRAIADLKPFTGAERASDEAVVLEAQVHLELARLGVASELQTAKTLLERPSKTDKPSADRQRAEGLRALAAADLAGARKSLKEVLARTPLDAAALCALGWAELESRDVAAAAAAFGRAASAEPSRAEALYGLGLAKESAGDGKAADELYKKALAASPEHLRARLAQLRLEAHEGGADAVEKIDALLKSKAAALAPRELAEGQVTLGGLALDRGAFDEAEDRFKKAQPLAGDAATSHLAWEARLGVARARLLAGRGTETIDDLRKLVGMDSRGVEPRLLLAEALITKQELKEVEPLLAAVEAQRPKEARVPFLRGRALVARTTAGKEEREQAVALFRTATTDDPSLLPAWAALAKTLHDLGRTPDALDALGKAAEALSADPRGAAVLGGAYLAIGKAADAEARFRTVLAATEGKGSADQLPVWLGLGESLEAQGKLAEAQSTYADAFKVAPKAAILIEKQARVALRNGKLDEAGKLFEQAMQIGTPSASLRVAAAELALKSRRFDEARTLAEGTLKEDDRSAPAALILARVELESGRPELALGMARRAATLRDLPEAHLVVAQVLERTNKLEAAADEYQLARRPPMVDEASLGHARVLVRRGASQDALTELLPLTKASTVRADALLLVGDCYGDLRQADKARHAYEDAVKAAPQLAEAHFKLGRAMLDAGRRQPGADELERATKLAPANTPWMADAYLFLGDAHRQGHKNEAAVQAYKRYLELAPPGASARAEAERQVAVLGGGGR